MSSQQGIVVVGVDGTEASTSAVRYGATVSRRSGRPLALVHVLPSFMPAPPIHPLLTSESMTEVAHHLLHAAREVAEDVAGPDVTVTTELRSGNRGHGLVEAGEHAHMVVLGHRPRGPLGRIMTTSVTTRVATRAHCLVVSVPEGWTPGEETGHVVVAVDDIGHAPELLRVAFETAEQRGARLTALHAWQLPVAYDDLVVERTDGETWTRELADDLTAAMADLRHEHPRVESVVDVRHERPVTALLAAAGEADELLVGRRSHGAPFGFHLGGVARAMVEHAACPVVVVPMRPRPDQVLDLDLADEDLLPQT
jgi:nucleotide-binding universal stress UspA family protein